MDEIGRARSPSKFADVPGAKIHYRLTGPDSAPLIVMVHGFSTPEFNFGQNAEALGVAGLRILQFDHLGCGRFYRPANRYDTDFYDWELLAPFYALKITEPAGFVGLSMGGPIVAQFAVRQTERVARMFLYVAAGFDVVGGERVQGSLIRTPVTGDWLWRMVAMKSVANEPQYDESGLVPEGRLQGYVRKPTKYRSYGRALLFSFRHFSMRGNEDTYAALAATGIPVTAIFGTKDPTVLIASADQMRAVIPETVVDIPEDADHGLNYKRHSDVNPILTGWFEQEAAWFENKPEPEFQSAFNTGEEDMTDPVLLGSMSQPSPNMLPREPSGPPCRMSRIGTRRCL